MADLEGKVTVITGASRGIGRAAAIEFARLGSDVVVAARTDTPRENKVGTVAETAREIEALGRKALAVRCDVSRQEDIDHLVQETLAAFGRCDILVNNAAVTGPLVFIPMAEITREQFERLLTTNITAPLMLTKAFSEGMKARSSGLVFNITSGQANLEDLASPRVSAATAIGYGTTKAGLNRLSNAMAGELLPFGIPCITVDPGFTDTQDAATTSNMDAGGWVDRPRAHPAAWPVAVLAYLATCPEPMAYTGQVVVTDTFVKDHALV